ncbi:MAG: hypothetical protein BWY19_00280 [bacterium ADurb.Bin212]|nr:MAG: hypothetical protein BWY19_00280 [bacterium ADurb.Bin212]
MKRRRLLKFVVSLAVILTQILPSLYDIKPHNTNQAQAGWFGFDWQYRQKYIISNSNSLTTDYQFLLDESIVGRFRFNDNSGSTVSDSSGFGHSGTITGLDNGISWTSSGKYSNALSFSGDNSTYVSVGNYDLYNNTQNNLSVSSWIKTADDDVQMRILSKGFDTATWSKGYFLEMNNGDIRMGVGGESEANSVLFSTTGTSFADDEWHHIVSVINSDLGIGAIYVDGVAQDLSAQANTCGTVDTNEIDISSCTSISLNNSSSSLYLGRNDSSASNAWNGTLDEAILFNRPLSADQVNYLYQSNSSPLLQADLYTHCKDDGSDLRITSSDGTTELFYYIERFDGSDQYARIWIKIPALSVGDNTIYIYYGNSSASSGSNWQNTFSYTDDFADEEISANWTVTEDGDGTIAEAGGDLDFNYDGTDTDWNSDPVGRGVNIIKYNTVPNYDFWAQIKILNYTVNDKTMAGISVYGSDTSAYLFGRKDGTADNDYSLDKIGSEDLQNISQTTLPAYLAVRKISTDYSFWLSFDNNIWYQMGSSSYSDVTFNNVAIFGKSWDGNSLSFSVDDFFIKKYLPITPTIEIDSFQETDTPQLEFTVEGVSAEEMHNGVTTSVGTSFNLISFGKLEITTPKYASHKLTVKSNSINGYTVTVKMDGYMQGLYPSNKIDPFGATGVSWTTPQVWSSPDGDSANSDSGWVGASTSDTRVSGWSDAYGKFGPLSSTPHEVMYSRYKDSGTTVYVTYAMEVSEKQPSDSYSGNIIYNIVPTY